MIYELLKNRRSIRKFKEEQPTKAQVDVLLKSMLLAPTSRGKNPWSFIVVDQPEILEQLAKAKIHGSAFLKGAPLAVVVIANQNLSDVWVEDTSIASIILQLSAEEMGLGSCWIQIRERMHNNEISSEDYVKSILHIANGYKVECIIAIGIPDEEKEGHQEPSLDKDKIYYNKM